MWSISLIHIIVMVFASSAQAQRASCLKEAKTLFAEVVGVVRLSEHQELQPAVDRLQDLYREGCYNPKDLTEPSKYHPNGYTDIYFDPATMEPTDEVKKSLKSNWNFLNERARMKALAGDQRAFTDEKQRLIALHEKYHPVDVPSPQDLQMLPEDARKAECQSLKTDIKKSLPPIRDQSSAGWCFFYSMADLLSAKLKKPISATYLASLLSPNGDGGSSVAAINRLIADHGLCYESTMPSNHLPNEYPDWVKEFESKARIYLETGNSAMLCSQMNQINALHPSASLASVLKVIDQATLPDGDVKSTNVIDSTSGPTVSLAKSNYLAHVALDRCQLDREATKSSVELAEVRTQNDPIKAFREINSVLDLGRPAAVAYNFNELMGGRLGGHVSTIVDRRMINNRCEFLVRNSWGASSCTRAVSENDACQPPGYFWVDAADLAVSVQSVSRAL